MLSQQLDLLDGFIQILDQGTSQLHLISEASHAAVTSSMQYHPFCSFFSSAREVAVLRMCHLLIHLMSYACLERPPRCKSLDHLADAADTIDHRAPVDHHTYMPKVRISTQQPWGPNKERGLARTWC
jgi:hypothetical protein